MEINLAAQILELNAKWETIDKIKLAENIENYLAIKFPDCVTYSTRLDKLVEITGSKRDSVYAWINRGRSNVKAPFLKVCAIAAALDVDIYELLRE